MGNCLGDGSNGNTSVAPNNSPDGNAREEAAPDWDSYEIGEKEIRAVFDAVFYVFDKDSRGYLTGDQFGTLMTTFANDCRPPVSITPRELASFQDILDKDKNGIVEQDEFVSFFFDLAWITPEDRAAFVKLGPMFAKLAAIAEAETERLRRWVYVIHALFERHFSEKLMSSKGLPVVGPIELGALMTEGLSLDEHPKRLYSPPDDKELKRFVKFMDNDQDELIDEQELICFCVKGLRQTPEANMAFASRSPMHAKLIGFLEAINVFSGADAFSSNVVIGEQNQDEAQAAFDDLDIQSYKALNGGSSEDVLEVKKNETPQPVPAVVQPVQPAVVQPAVVQPAVVQPAVVQPAVVQPAVVQPAAVQPAAQPAVIQPAVVQPAVVQPAVVQPAVVQPAVVQPAAAQPAAQPAVIQPAVVQPAAAQPTPSTAPKETE